MDEYNNIPTEEQHDHRSRNTRELAQLAFPYLLQLFHAGLEGRHGLRLSIQCADDGTFKGVIGSVKNLGKSTEIGIVAFTNSESLDGVFAYFEDALTYGELKWRTDKFWLEAKAAPPKPAKKRKKVEMRL